MRRVVLPALALALLLAAQRLAVGAAGVTSEMTPTWGHPVKIARSAPGVAVAVSRYGGTLVALAGKTLRVRFKPRGQDWRRSHTVYDGRVGSVHAVIDDRDTRHLVWIEDFHVMAMRRPHDGTWSRPVRLGGPGRFEHPTLPPIETGHRDVFDVDVASDPHGRVLLSWVGYTAWEGQCWDSLVRVTEFVPGRGWGATRNLSRQPGGSATCNRPAGAVDDRGRATVSYEQYDDGPGVAVRKPGGAWHHVRPPAVDGKAWVRRDTLADVDSRGRVTLAFGLMNRLVTTTRSAHGRSWSKLRTVSHDGHLFGLSVSDAGDITVGYVRDTRGDQHVYVRQRPHGHAWRPPVRMPHSRSGGVLAGNAAGDVVIGWTTALAWRPSGGTWSAPVPLFRWNNPTVAIGDAGDAVAVYSRRTADGEWKTMARTLPGS